MSTSVDLSSYRVSVSGIDRDTKIYDINFNINFNAPTEIDISFVNEAGVYAKPNLDCENPQVLKIGETSINVYPTSYKIERRSSGRLMVVRYSDSSIKYLDKYLVSFKDIEDDRVINVANVLLPSSSNEAFQTTGYRLADLLSKMLQKKIPVSAKARNLLSNADNFISDQEYQRVFVLEEVGSLRDVLSSYGSKIGCVFYWDFLNEQIDAIQTRNGVSKADSERLFNEIKAAYESKVAFESEGASIADSVAQSAIVYDVHSTNNSSEAVFVPFERVKSETSVDWVAKLASSVDKTIPSNTFRFEQRGIGPSGNYIAPNQIAVKYENSFVKLLFAVQAQCLTEYIYAVMLKEAIRNRRILEIKKPYKANVRGGPSPDIENYNMVLPDSFSSLQGNTGITSTFGHLYIVDYVDDTVENHLNSLIFNERILGAELFRSLTGYNQITGQSSGLLGNTDKKYFICVVPNNIHPKSSSDGILAKAFNTLLPLAQTYSSLYVSTREFTKTSLHKYSQYDGEWIWNYQSIADTPLNGLAQSKFPDIQNVANIAFNPFWQTFAFNNNAENEPILDDKKSDNSKGRLVIDLKNSNKSSMVKDAASCFLKENNEVSDFSLSNIALQKIGYQAVSNNGDFSVVILFEDALLDVLDTVNKSYLNIVPKNKFSRKFILDSSHGSFLNLDYKTRLSNTKDPLSTSNAMRIIKAPSISDISIPSDSTELPLFTQKIDLDYILNFLDSQGAFSTMPEAIDYSLNIVDYVVPDKSWLQRGLEGFSISIGDRGISCNINISNRKKLFQNAEEMVRLVADDKPGFASVKKIRKSISEISSRIQW